jgi:hypothetical protein
VATVCLRCGDFPSGETLLAEKISLCRECFERRSIDEGALALAPPPAVRRLRRILLFGALVLGFGVGGLLGGALLQRAFLPVPGRSARGVAMVAGAAGGGLACELLVLFVFIVLALRHGDRSGWKKHLMERLGLETVDPARFTLVTMKVPGRPAERGILLVDEGGLALLGNRGSRVVVPFSEVTFTKAVTPRWYPWVVYAAVKDRDGRMVVMSCGDGPTRAANRAATRALADTIAGRVRR